MMNMQLCAFDVLFIVPRLHISGLDSLLFIVIVLIMSVSTAFTILIKTIVTQKKTVYIS